MEEIGIIVGTIRCHADSYTRPMKTLTSRIIDADLADRLITDAQLARLVTGTDQRRYHLVNRAAAAGELFRLRRGLYVLADRFRSRACHPFAVAQMMEPGSYVSLQSALAFHGWIPEAVYTTTSILPGRKSRTYRQERFGAFSFHPLAIRTGNFLELVHRTEADGLTFLLASPVRAFMDLVCFRKIAWRGMDWIEQDMRIDRDVWSGVTGAELKTLAQVYKHRRVRDFLGDLRAALGLETGDE